MGNDASRNLQVKMAAGSWTSVRKANFGTGAKSFLLRVKGTGKLEIRIGRRGVTAAATVEFSSSTYQDYIVEVDETKFTGVKNLYFVFTESANDNVQFDAWQFFKDDLSGIGELQAPQSAPVNKGSYDLGGRRLQNTSGAHGVVIENGKKVMR